ncbi:hypothetical protein KALB_6679 [Kutzneria albida DSM 43870]|uniref:Solute-binding protein family 3/N-terminal domain-containing protein n=1 Tax=Kutzneria albida DSM 43870 TaxID=1449976 RepID=W5WGQ6_9PSEU|nr:hypothetical protein KALB_6679 [Kutzneria albida DSM 43870]
MHDGGVIRTTGARVAAVLAGCALFAGCAGGDAQPGPPPATATTTTAAPSGAVSGSPTYDRIHQRGRITVALRTEQPGLAHRDPASGDYSGFEVDLARLVATKLGLTADQIQFKQLPPGAGLGSVSSGDADLYLGGATAEQGRSAQLLAAGPYLNAHLGLLYRQSGPAVTDPASAAGRRICSVSDSPAQAAARALKITDPDKLLGSNSLADCVDQLGSGTVDAVVQDLPAVAGYAESDPTNLAAADLPGGQPLDYVVLLPGNDKPLRDRINQVLRAAIADGTWQRLYDAALARSGIKATPPTIP